MIGGGRCVHERLGWARPAEPRSVGDRFANSVILPPIPNRRGYRRPREIHNCVAHSRRSRHRMIDTVEPGELIARFGAYVEERDATLLVGAGLSQAAGYPDWHGLLMPIQDDLAIGAMDDLALVAQYYANEHGQSALEQRIRQVLEGCIKAQPQVSHRLLAKLPLTEIWTTNYDDLIERAIGVTTDLCVDDSDLAQPRSASGCRVYKMHGSLCRANTPLIIARDQYDQYPHTHQRFWALLQATFLTKSFLFLGFSFEDPNFKQVFKAARLAQDDVRRQHFALIKKPKDQIAASRFEHWCNDLMNIGITVAALDEYDEIGPLLRQLVVRCRPRRLFVSGSPPGHKQSESDGSYPSATLDSVLHEYATALGRALADTPAIVSAAGKFGAAVGYQMLKETEEQGGYKPDRFLLVRRRKEQDVDDPRRRYGTILFGDRTPDGLREEALGNVQALLAVGGGSGVATEIRLAQEQGIGVIPVGKFGGTSLDEWQRVSSDFDNYRLGGLPVPRQDFNLLRDGDVAGCSTAAARLVDQALYRREE